MTKKLEILVIDNDPIYQLVTKKLLSKSELDFEIKSYINGLEALNTLLNEKKPDTKKMLLLDLDMPIMNGWEFLEAYYDNQLHQNNEDCIYIVTSSIAQEDKSKAKNYPVVHGYFEKPLNINAINEVIHGCLKS